jgi:Rrf2 family iron-sulfur cluster assembly transcriptional regulator
MKISTKARYAVMAMIELAMNENSSPINLTDISRSQGISLSYLEQLFANLRKNGLVKGRRGPGGGYRLAMPPNEISIAKIVGSVNDNTSAMHRRQANGDPYVPADMWDKLSDRITDYLEGISLAECMQSAESGSFQQKVG